MNTAVAELNKTTSAIPPYPEGWFYVATRKEILKKKLIERTWMGEKIVAWCDKEGRICVSTAICPHLGADLGPAAGGRVRDGVLVCPFHGYQFEVGGKCIATPYAPAPKNTALRTFETQEDAGIVFAWWGKNGRPAQWHIPVDDAEEDASDWSGLNLQTLRFRGHPQDTTENIVDLSHLMYVHGYDSVTHKEPLVVEGPYLTRAFDFRRPQSLGKLGKMEFDVSTKTQVFGLGYSYVQIHERSIGIRARMRILATPLNGTEIDLVIVNQVRRMPKPKRKLAGMAFVPPNVRHKVMNTFFALMQKHDVMQDVEIWSRKEYIAYPRLCRSDGEIGKFRRYCKQFYPDDFDFAEGQ